MHTTSPRSSSRLTIPVPLVIAFVLFVSGWTATLSAQEPKVGRDVYIDNVDLGFQIKVPKDWDLIPPKPNEVNLIAKYSPRHNKYVTMSGGETLSIDVLLLRFDEAEPAASPDEEDAEVVVRLGNRVRTAEDFIKERLGPAYGRGHTFDHDKYPKKLKGPKGVESTYTVYRGFTNPDEKNPTETGLFVAEFALNDNTTIAMMGFGPGDKKWRQYEKAYLKLAKSFKVVEIVDPFEEARNAPDAHTLRGKKRLELMEKVAKSGDWKLYETPNYFIISANDDKQFLEELMMRLEAIRDVYVVDYPADKARSSAARPTSGEHGEGDDDEGGVYGPDGEEEEEEEDPDAANRSVSAFDNTELARTSVVRVCRSRAEYHEYGGPGGSAGYWSSSDQELVIYDDKAYGGRADTWIVLNHEAFHQYIFYFYGNIAPHSWYNEGTGDYYSGYQLKNGRFRLKENSWRKSTIKEMIREGEYVPLKDIVHWTQREYYGNNELGIGGGQCYAQGWSFIYFLRTGKGKCKDWQDSWDGILDTYLDTLARTGDLEESVNIAFEGVDWAALEKAWKKYIG